jgi:hypothetical protein
MRIPRPPRTPSLGARSSPSVENGYYAGLRNEDDIETIPAPSKSGIRAARKAPPGASEDVVTANLEADPRAEHDGAEDDGAAPDVIQRALIPCRAVR